VFIKGVGWQQAGLAHCPQCRVSQLYKNISQKISELIYKEMVFHFEFNLMIIVNYVFILIEKKFNRNYDFEGITLFP
jgi:hypothetical protein